MPGSTRTSTVDRMVRVVAVGVVLRIEVSTTGTAHAITYEGIKALNAVLDSAPHDYAITGARRERVSISPGDTTRDGGRLDIPDSENASAIAELVADDLRAVLAQPGHLVRVEDQQAA